jgi:hypothetical protein
MYNKNFNFRGTCMNKNYGILLFVLLICFASHGGLYSMQPAQRITAAQLSKALGRKYPIITTRTFDYKAPTMWQGIYRRFFGPRLEVKQAVPDAIANLKQQEAIVESLIKQNEAAYSKYSTQEARISSELAHPDGGIMSPITLYSMIRRGQAARNGMKQAMRNIVELDKVHRRISWGTLIGPK